MNLSNIQSTLPEFLSFESVHSICRPKELEQLQESTVVTRYSKGELLFSENSHCLGIYCIMDGLVKTFKSLNGKDQVIHLSQREEMLGHSIIISGKPHDCSAMALTDTEVHILPKDDFKQLLKNSDGMKSMILELQAVEIINIHTKLLEMLHKPVSARLAALLLLLDRRYKNELEDGSYQILHHREHLAGMIGTTRESIIRFLSMFKEEGLIHIDNRSINILKKEALEKKDIFF